MSDPHELPNIPRDLKVVKQAFLPKRGMFHFADYSQIEPRLFAYFTARALGDPTIADWYREGRDVYREIASRVHGKPSEQITEDERQHGKVWFLMSLYGAGPRKVSETIGMTYAEAKDFYLAFHEGLPQIKLLSNPKPQSERAMRFWTPGSIEKVYARRGFIRTPWGRHLHAEQWGEHKLLNKLIQGTAADIMKAALLLVDDWQMQAGIETRMVSVIHDEIVLDGPPSEAALIHEHVPRLMIEAARAPGGDNIHEIVPFAVDHEVSVTTWADKIEYDEWKESVGSSYRHAA